MPGKPGWCIVNSGDVPKNSTPWLQIPSWKRGGMYKSKRMVIHDTSAFVAWCYESMLVFNRNKQLCSVLFSEGCG